MANIIGTKKYTFALVKTKDGKLAQVPCQLPSKQKQFLERSFENSKNFHKNLEKP